MERFLRTRRTWSLVVPVVLIGFAAGGEAAAEEVLTAKDARTLKLALRRARAGDRIVLAEGTRLSSLTLKASDLRIEGNGAQIRGSLKVRGDRVTLSGFTVAGTVTITGDGSSLTDATIAPTGRTKKALVVDGALLATVQDVQVARGGVVADDANGLLLAGVTVHDPKATVHVTGDGVVLDGNAFGPARVGIAGDDATVKDTQAGGIEVDGHGAVLAGNHVQTGAITVAGDGAKLDGNVAAAVFAHDSDALTLLDNEVGRIEVTGDAALVAGNVVRTELDPTAMDAILVTGDDAVVSGNTVDAPLTGISVFGGSPRIDGNVVESGGPESWGSGVTPVAIQVIGGDSEAVISGNEVHHEDGFGILVTADDVTVQQNLVEGVWPLDSIRVEGDAVVVVGNSVAHDPESGNTGNGIVLVGDGIRVVGNTVESARFDGIQVSSGEDNLLEENTILDTTRCGISVTNATSGTTLTNCTVLDGLAVGVVIGGPGVTLTTSTMTNNECVDLFVTTNDATMNGNTFSTFSDRPITGMPTFNFGVNWD